MNTYNIQKRAKQLFLRSSICSYFRRNLPYNYVNYVFERQIVNLFIRIMREAYREGYSQGYNDSKNLNK